MSVLRTKGYSATPVDKLCTAAGVTKGAFFHHCRSKDELAVAAADYWSEMTGAWFANAPYHDHADPLAGVPAYVAFRKALSDLISDALQVHLARRSRGSG